MTSNAVSVNAMEKIRVMLDSIPLPLPPRPWRKRGIILLASAGLGLIVWETFALSPDVRIVCAKAIGLFGPRTLPLVYQLSYDRDARVALAAMEILVQAGGDAVPTLLDGLAQGEPNHRVQNVDLLGRIGPAAAAAIPRLVELAGNDPEAVVRERALVALANVGPDDPASQEALIHGLRDAEPSVRRGAVRLFGSIGPKARYAIPALAKSLRDDPSREVRFRVTVTLGEIGPDERAVAALAKALSNDDDSNVRTEAAESLGTFGPDARGAVLSLAQGLKDANERVRQESAEALGKIGPSARAAIPQLREALQDPAERVAREAKDALGRIGE